MDVALGKRSKGDGPRYGVTGQGDGRAILEKDFDLIIIDM